MFTFNVILQRAKCNSPFYPNQPNITNLLGVTSRHHHTHKLHIRTFKYCTYSMLMQCPPSKMPHMRGAWIPQTATCLGVAQCYHCLLFEPNSNRTSHAVCDLWYMALGHGLLVWYRSWFHIVLYQPLDHTSCAIKPPPQHYQVIQSWKII